MGPIATEFSKWQKWAQLIKSDVQKRLVHPRQVFRGFVETVNSNAEHIDKHDGEVFVQFVQCCYVSHIAMAIRCHVKQGSGSISLMRLLVQLRECANQFTYPFYLQQFRIDPSYVDWQCDTFSCFASVGFGRTLRLG